jgi:hypothetical protein
VSPVEEKIVSLREKMCRMQIKQSQMGLDNKELADLKTCMDELWANLKPTDQGSFNMPVVTPKVKVDNEPVDTSSLAPWEDEEDAGKQ